MNSWALFFNSFVSVMSDVLKYENPNLIILKTFNEQPITISAINENYLFINQSHQRGMLPT